VPFQYWFAGLVEILAGLLIVLPHVFSEETLFTIGLLHLVSMPEVEKYS